jgi:cAMP phosphodiesterase
LSGGDVHLKILGSAGSEFPDYHSPAYLIDSSLLIDAGTICSVLPLSSQIQIKSVLISHSHLDHIKGLPFLADNIMISGGNKSIRLISTPEVLNAVRCHIFNNIIWPDFSIIPSKDQAVIEYLEVQAESEFELDGYSITPVPVNHSVPAIGFLIRKNNSALIYTGDTGPTERIWQMAENISAIIVEVSFPNNMNDLAVLTGHLTPSLLSSELQKLKTLPPVILITHPKPQFRDLIISELNQLQFPGIKLMSDGDEYYL